MKKQKQLSQEIEQQIKEYYQSNDKKSFTRFIAELANAGYDISRVGNLLDKLDIDTGIGSTRFKRVEISVRGWRKRMATSEKIPTALITDLRDDTQSRNLCRFLVCNLGRVVSIIPHEASQPQDFCIGKGKVLSEYVRSQIEVVGRIHQTLSHRAGTPRQLRTYSPQLVEALLYQTEILIDRLVDHALPHMERIDSNKM